MVWAVAAFAQAPLLKVGPDKHHLVDEAGTPFQLRGEAAWCLPVQLTREQAVTYLDDRMAKGFNALMVELINAKDGYAANAPKNAYGELPFIGDDFRKRNEAYWTHIDYLVDEAGKRGMAVLAVPLYLGYGGGSEGWYNAAVSAGAEAIKDYGAFLGARYAGKKNILWVNGGDFRPPTLAIPDALASGILSMDKTHLFTTHWARNSAGTDGNPSWLTLNSTYAGVDNIIARTLADYARSPALPSFLIEGHYEGPLSGQPSLTTREVRSQAWQAYLSGACGNFYAHHAVWLFGGGWNAALNSPGAQSLARQNAFFAKREWWKLVPDTAMVTSGQRTGKHRISAARAEDGSFAVIYVPDGSTGNFVLDYKGMKGNAVKASSFDPHNGAVMDFPGGPQPKPGMTFNMVGKNADPATAFDWVILLEGVDISGIAPRPRRTEKRRRTPTGILPCTPGCDALGRSLAD